MKIKRNVTISLKPKKKNCQNVTENLQIRIRITYGSIRVDLGTGYNIDQDKWDALRQRVKNGAMNKLRQTASVINSDLSRNEAAIDDVFVLFEQKGKIPSQDEFKDTLAIKLGNNKASPAKQNPTKKQNKRDKNSKLSFWQVYDLFVKECGRLNDWTDATYEKFAAAKNHLKNFDEHLTFESLDENKMNDYVIYLRNDKGLRNSTIAKQIGFFKWFLRWADHKGYNNNRVYEIFKPKLKYARKVVVFLCEDELIALREMKIPEHKQYLERVRDVFLFCCWTGLRYSDVYNLKKCDIKDEYFEIVTIKTLDKLIIDYNLHSRAILEKYKDVSFDGGKALPVISNQKMNDYIKELCELAGFNEEITLTYFKGNERIEDRAPKYSLIGTHTGRRSFICNALALGIGVETVMQWTGHNDFKSMKPYIDVANHLRAKSMKKFDDFAKRPVVSNISEGQTVSA